MIKPNQIKNAQIVQCRMSEEEVALMDKNATEQRMSRASYIARAALIHARGENETKIQ